MKFKYSIYELVNKKKTSEKQPAPTRKGALLAIEFEDGSVGYADCHPWKEFGDQPLQTQLNLLKQGKCTRLTARSIHFAKLDAKARVEKRNLLENLKPTSHYTLFSLFDEESVKEVELAAKDGFDTFKIKLGNQLNKEEDLLKEIIKKVPNISLRLDFNAKVNKDQFIAFLDRISSVREKIEFIEDPFVYDYASWRQVQESFGIPLAADLYYKQAFGNPESAKVLVMKPAVHSFKPVDASQKLIITSYLDHPVGQMAASYMAAKVSDEVAGLLSHYVYQPTNFSQMIKHEGNKLLPVQGYGFGFDELLKNQEFITL